jgi:hypothetical protein
MIGAAAAVLGHQAGGTLMWFVAGVRGHPASMPMNTSMKQLLWLAALGVAFIAAAWPLGMAYVLTD